MSFSQATITSVSVVRDDVDLLLTWQTTSPVGTTFQVYIDHALAWNGTETSCLIPWPSGLTQIDVGAVAAGEGEVDFSASLPAAPANHADLQWLGGTYLDPDIQSFNAYMGSAPGGAVSYTKPVATITAYPLGIITDGFGMGGFGLGGFGMAASNYEWKSDPLAGGVWNFAVKPVDVAGNEGAAQLASVTIAAPPRPPAVNAVGIRLHYTYVPLTHIVTLNWSASPA